jgi:hypothetical protein
MRPFIALCLFVFTSSLLWSQETSMTVKAQVINAQNKESMSAVHVINLTQVKGTITDQEGRFTLTAQANDTLYLSYLGFKPLKVRVTSDMFRFDNTIELTELAYALEEVVLKPYQLTGYLEIDVRRLPVEDAFQYSISGLSVGYEAGSRKPNAASKVLGAILNPADLLRNIFGKQPRKMRQLQQMKQDDAINDLLASKFDRLTLQELLGLEKVDIEDILTNCNYSKSFIATANDLQILDAISECYESYRVLNRKQ